MITLFACPKPFTDPHTAVIQRNAITSWTLLRPRPEIILFADEPGTSEICQKIGLRHVPDTVCNEYGTPLVNDLFEKAQRWATYDLLCYINADIILMNDFMAAVERLKAWGNRFLAIGSRCDLEIFGELDFNCPDWDQRLRTWGKERGKDTPLAADYFIFPRGFYRDIPPLVLGRLCFDNWLIWKARHSHSPVVDLSPVVLAVHQSHWTSQQLLDLQNSQEVKLNKKWVGSWKQSFNLFSATHQLTAPGIWGITQRVYKHRLSCLIGLLKGRIRLALGCLGLRRRRRD